MLYTRLKRKIKEIKELQKIGVVPMNITRDIEIFEEFHRYPELCKECRYEMLAEKYGFKHPSSIKHIVRKLSKKI